MSIRVSPTEAETKRPDSEQGVMSPQRRQLLALGAAGAVAVGAGLSLGASPAQADILRGLKGFLYLDPLVVNFAYEMEELESDFFRRAVQSSAFDKLNGREKSVFELIAYEDKQHFEALATLRAAKGEKSAGRLETSNASSSRRPGMFSFGSYNSREKLFETALDIKETVLFAYHGAVDIVAKDTLMLAAAIAGVEGRHLAVLRELNGVDPVPEPFEKRLYPDAVGKRLRKYGFNGGGYGFTGGAR